MSSDTLPTPTELLPFRQIAKRLSEAHIRADERAKVTHEHFNVFTTVLKASDEVRLHTRFIHCLLDPKGSHDCGTLFLNLFFETLNRLPGLNHDGEQSTFGVPDKNLVWTVHKEAFRADFGQMDILLECKGHGIAIENKIDANEHRMDQLISYANYLESHSSVVSPLVIYLTLHGKESYTAGDKSYLRISYAVHILEWLEKCLQATYQIIPINQVLLQYRQVVRQITNKTLNAESMKEIVKFVRDNPDIIRFRSEIADAANEAIQQIWNEIEGKIRKSCPKGYAIRVGNPYPGGRFGNETSDVLIITALDGSVLWNAPFEIWIEHDNIDNSGENGELGIGVRQSTDPIPNDLIKALKEVNVPGNVEDENRYPLGCRTIMRGLDDKNILVSAERLDTDIIWEYVNNVEKAFRECTDQHAHLNPIQGE
jgi:hypothetical protein